MRTYQEDHDKYFSALTAVSITDAIESPAESSHSDSSGESRKDENPRDRKERKKTGRYRRIRDTEVKSGK
jgi:hypothetical protein